MDATTAVQRNPQRHFSGTGYHRTDCRLCRCDRLRMVLDFGMHPHSGGFPSQGKLDEAEPVFPLAVNLCQGCGHAQLSYVVDPAYLYEEGYLYDRATTETGRHHFHTLARDLATRFDVPRSSLAVDIGNVGRVLTSFRDQGLLVQGVDLTPRMAQLAANRGIPTGRCFSGNVAAEIVADHGRAQIVTATNVVHQIDELDDFMFGIDKLLSKTGVFVIEVPYFRRVVQNLEYDTIYHQHLSYFSVTPFVSFAARHDMEVFDVIEPEKCGGIVRILLSRVGTRSPSREVHQIMAEESEFGLSKARRLSTFAEQVHWRRHNLVALLQALRDGGSTIAGVGAPARGSTLLNTCGINASVLTFTVEENPLKVGRYIPGSRIPIVSDAELLEARPDYALILSWRSAAEVMRHLAAFCDHGGRFIIPIPEPTIM